MINLTHTGLETGVEAKMTTISSENLEPRSNVTQMRLTTGSKLTLRANSPTRRILSVAGFFYFFMKFRVYKRVAR